MEKQIHFPEAAVKSEATTADKPDFKQEERKGEIKGTGMIKDRTDGGRRSDRRDKNLRKPSFQTSASKQGKRGRIDKKPDGKRNIRIQYKHDIPRRGAHVSRQGQRKGSGHNIGSNLGGILATIGAGAGDSLLPIPSTASLPVDVVSNVASSFQAVEMLNYALQQNIQQNIQETVDLLTNPPPVPGETTNRFTESLKQPSRLAQDNLALQASDRPQNHLPGGKNARTQDRVAFSKIQTPSQHNKKRQDTRPKWSQQPLKEAYGNLGCAYDTMGDFRKAIEHHEKHLKIALEIGDLAGEGGTYGNLGTAYQSLGECISGTKHTFKQDENGSDLSVGVHETVELADSGINTNRRQVDHASSSSHHCDPQGSLSKRKSSFQDKDENHGSKILIRTSPNGLPQPDNMTAHQTYSKPLCSLQLQTGKCLDSHCQCWHLSKAELEEVQLL